MNVIPKNEMDQRVVQMMERMCFVLVDPMDEDHGAAANHRANIDFWGDQCRGNVSIEASDGFLLEVASSLLGLEPEDQHSDCSAAIKDHEHDLRGTAGTHGRRGQDPALRPARRWRLELRFDSAPAEVRL
ncbi:MAG: hypothetical protein R3E96_07440 [Planctomycetota bacterium]